MRLCSNFSRCQCRNLRCGSTLLERLVLTAGVSMIFGAALFFCGGVAIAQTNSSGESKIKLLGVAEISPTATDNSGLHQSLGEDYFNDLLGGFSAIEYTGEGNLFYLLPDRGPLDGAVDWTCRVQKFAISVQPKADEKISNVSANSGSSVNSNSSVNEASPTEMAYSVDAKLVETILLTDREGRPFTGNAAALTATAEHPLRLDPEGIRVGASGNFFISDEYGPSLFEYTPKGRLVKQLPVPARFLIANPQPNSDDEDPVNETGRQANRGMEGLAISPNQKMLFGLLQSSLLQDSERVPDAKRGVGESCRMVQISVNGKTKKELLYHLDDPQYGLNEVCAADRHHFVVIERDGEKGAEAKFKKLMLISDQDATDISHIDHLPAHGLPADVQPLKKKVLIDLLDPQWGLAGDQMPEKIEGLTFGPNLPDGRRLLLVGSDNDFEPDSPSHIYVFAVPPELLKF